MKRIDQTKALLSASRKALILAEKRRARQAKLKAADDEASMEEDKEEAEEDKEMAEGDKKEEAVEAASASPLSDAGKPDLGETEYGFAVPPELKSKVEQGKAPLDDSDASHAPGVLVPPGLEDAVMAFVDPAELSASAEAAFDMIPFLPHQARTAQEVLSAGAHWVLCMNGDPLAKIRLQDQDDADKIAAHFVTPDYARTVIDGIDNYGLSATLGFVKAKPYVAKVDESARIQKIKAQLTAESTAKVRSAVADVKARFVENLALVLKASASNYLVENPLKDGFIAWATSVGVPEGQASEAADAVFFQYGEKAIAGLLDKAEEWTGFTPEALEQVKATVESAGRRSRPLPSQMSFAQANPDYDHALAARMVASAVPVQQPYTLNTLAAKAEQTPRAQEATTASEATKASFRARFGGFR